MEVHLLFSWQLQLAFVEVSAFPQWSSMGFVRSGGDEALRSKAPLTQVEVNTYVDLVLVLISKYVKRGPSTQKQPCQVSVRSTHMWSLRCGGIAVALTLTTSN